MLQDYLNANLLSVVTDEDFKKLKKASDEVAKKLGKNKNKTVSYILAAIDPEVLADDTDIIEVKDIIIKNWSTFLTNAKDTPVTYVRAVILEAVKHVCAADYDYSMIIWMVSRNIIQYKKLIGDEKEIIYDFLQKIGSDLNSLAIEKWRLKADSTTSKLNIELKNIEKYLINDDNLIKYFEDAVGPHNEAGAANFASPNPNWPNAGTNWSYEFPKRASKGIKNVIDLSLKAIANVVNENKNAIESSLKNALTIINEDNNSLTSLQLRSELLWWKEAAYSESFDKSYSEIDRKYLELALAYDYSSLIPVLYPKSADYFLKETFRDIVNDSIEEITFKDYLIGIQEKSVELKAVLPEVTILDQKLTLSGFISGLVWNKYALDDFQSLVGVSLDEKLLKINLIVWLFHDKQINKILIKK